MPSRTPATTVVLLILLPFVLVLGMWLGGHPRWLPDPVANVFAGGEDRRVALEALDIVHDRYYRPVEYGKLSDAAIGGAVKDLEDRFSAYFTASDYRKFQLALGNEFEGIGVAVREVKEGLAIEKVYDGAPAARAGIKPGDIITHVDGRSIAGVDQEKSTTAIKGPRGTKVRLRLRRGKRSIERTVTRAAISVPVVASRIANAGGERAGYIALSTFGPRTAHQEMAAAIRRLKQRKAKGFVLDLRGNGGGLVSEAQLIASMFIADGTIVTTRGRAVKEVTLEAVGQPIAGKLPTVVLVDRGSASASEIVAGALQDRKRATLVGTKTFGKGVFQEILPLPNGGALDITVGQYFLPSGRNLGGAGTSPGDGLKPDVQARDDPDTPRRDEALDRALDVLAKQL